MHGDKLLSLMAMRLLLRPFCMPKQCFLGGRQRSSTCMTVYPSCPSGVGQAQSTMTVRPLECIPEPIKCKLDLHASTLVFAGDQSRTSLYLSCCVYLQVSIDQLLYLILCVHEFVLPPCFLAIVHSTALVSASRSFTNLANHTYHRSGL